MDINFLNPLSHSFHSLFYSVLLPAAGDSQSTSKTTLQNSNANTFFMLNGNFSEEVNFIL